MPQHYLPVRLHVRIDDSRRLETVQRSWQ